MSVNSSSSSFLLYHCSNSIAGNVIYFGFLISKTLLLLPLSIQVLYVALRRCQQQQRSFATTSHSDIFTYHVAAMECITAFGVAVYFGGFFTGVSEIVAVGLYASSFILIGQVLFNTLTCVERYLAVVHPVTYLRLRQSGGFKIRNTSIVCVWLLCFAWSILIVSSMPDFPFIPYICLLVFALIVVSFCSLRVTCVLIRPRPGEVVRDREPADQSKQKAFHIVMTIMGVFWFGFTGFMICLSLDVSPLLSYNDGCIALIIGYWFAIPSYLVLPLFFLHRARMLLCCNYSDA